MDDTINEEERIERIKNLNDQLRRYFIHGDVFITNGIQSLNDEFVEKVINKVKSFSDFTEDNDPYGEHDFGAFTLEGKRINWKIDYYDLDMKFHSRDASNPIVTKRVLTIMLAEEY